MSLVDRYSFYFDKYGAELSLSLIYFAVIAFFGLLLILRRASLFGLVITKLAQFGFVLGFSIFSLSHHNAFDLINKTTHGELSQQLFELDIIVLPIVLGLIALGLFFINRINQRKGNLEAIFAIVFVLLTGLIHLSHQAFGHTDLIIQKTYFTEILYTPHEIFVHYLGHVGLAVLLLIIFYRPIFIVGFDKSQAHVLGLNFNLHEFIFYFLTGIIVAVCLRLMGLYISMAALLVPGLLCMHVFRSWRMVLVITPALGVLMAASGFLVSFTFDKMSAEPLILANYAFWSIALVVGAKVLRK